MDPNYKHHVTLTRRERQFNGGDNGVDKSYHLIGTAEQISAEVTRWVMNGLEHNHGPVTITPIGPWNIIDLETR